MSDETQPTRPAEGEPVEIPVPKRGDVLAALRKVAKAPESPDRDGGAEE